MSDAWVYIDESQGPAGDAVAPGTPFWVGALVLEHKVSAEVIRSALANLAADPDATGNAADQRILARRYFHASADSKNAHSWLCRSIVDSGLTASFSASEWFFDRDDSEDYAGARLHRLAALLTSSSTFQNDFDRVHVRIARRVATFDERHVDAWPAYCRETELMGLLHMPSLPGRFPAIAAELVNGEDPGIQICDFLLWAVQRARPESLVTKGDDTWLKRVKLRLAEQGGRVQGAHQQLRGELGTWKRQDFLPPLGERPRDVEKLSDPERFELVKEIAVNVRTAASLAVGHPRIGHLADDLTNAVGGLPRMRAGNPGAGEAARSLMLAYVLVCDTLPVYALDDAAEYARASEKRSLAAAYLLRGEPLWLPFGASL